MVMLYEHDTRARMLQNKKPCQLSRFQKASVNLSEVNWGWFELAADAPVFHKFLMI